MNPGVPEYKVSSQAKTSSGWRKASSVLLNIVLAAGVFLVVSAIQARNMLPTSGHSAPALELPVLGGGDFSLEGNRGRPTLVYFFAPWCAYCKASSDNLVRLRRWRDESDLEIVAVVLDWQDLDEVRRYVERYELNVPVLLGNSSIARDWKVFAFPTYYVLDGRNTVRHRDIGYSTQLGMWWRSRIVN